MKNRKIYKKALVLMTAGVLSVTSLTGCFNKENKETEEQIVGINKEKYVDPTDINYLAQRNGNHTTIYYTEESNGVNTIYSGQAYRDIVGVWNVRHNNYRENLTDVLVTEQTINPDNYIVYVDKNGIAYYYCNYELVQKVDLVNYKYMAIEESEKHLLSDSEYRGELNQKEIEKTLIK